MKNCFRKQKTSKIAHVQILTFKQINSFFIVLKYIRVLESGRSIYYHDRAFSTLVPKNSTEGMLISSCLGMIVSHPMKLVKICLTHLQLLSYCTQHAGIGENFEEKVIIYY